MDFLIVESSETVRSPTQILIRNTFRTRFQNLSFFGRSLPVFKQDFGAQGCCFGRNRAAVDFALNGDAAGQVTAVDRTEASLEALLQVTVHVKEVLVPPAAPAAA